MALSNEENINESQAPDPIQLIQSEFDETNRSLIDITHMLEQSRVELGKLTQRNATLTARLQQIHDQVGKIPAEEIRSVYESALDAQQRLFVMRGQLEKLQGDQVHLQRYKDMLLHLKDALNTEGQAVGKKNDTGPLAGVEMLVNAQEAERQRLSRQMHDGPAQALSNFILQTEIAMRLLDVDPVQARSELNNLKVSAMSTFQKVRNFIFELRPMMLDDLGLAPTIRRYADTFKEQASVDVNVLISGTERRLESYIEVMVFRSMQEILSNAVHQNQATSVKIQMDMGDTLIRLSVDDNGKGVDPDFGEKESNLGLKLIKERAEMLGGKFEIDSTPGKGTRITLAIPVHD
jgi:two-component system, NarL family, sensor histidine kinase DegS